MNNLSLAMKLTYGESAFSSVVISTLRQSGLGGTPRRTAEVRVVKVNHHGATTSSTKRFRDAVDPQVAVMMHDAIADLMTYRSWQRMGAQTFVTSIDGAVLVSTAGDGEYFILTQFDRNSGLLN